MIKRKKNPKSNNIWPIRLTYLSERHRFNCWKKVAFPDVFESNVFWLVVIAIDFLQKLTPKWPSFRSVYRYLIYIHILFTVFKFKIYNFSTQKENIWRKRMGDAYIYWRSLDVSENTFFFWAQLYFSFNEPF